MVNDSNKTLLEKYDLQLDQLDYNFIRECKNVKTLERILIVLRSGEEGIFPDLIKFCENELKELAPNSRLLNPVKRILRYSDLPENERNEIGNDIQKWSEELKSVELTTDVTEDVSIDMPPVRGQSLKIDSSKKDKAPSDERLKTKRCAQRSYSEWEKFDVDEELKKLDGNEHQRTSKEDKKVKTHPGLSKSVSISGLSEKERGYVANLEKNKGNEAFKAGDYDEAVVYYTRSLSVLRSMITLNNRAQAYLKLKNYLAAVQDCNEVISQEPNNIKALYRRGTAYKEEGICDLAKLDFKVVLELDPENKLAKEQLTQIKQLKMPKTANKKVFIEEIKSDESQNGENEARDNTATEKCTRLTIEEINSNDTITKLTNLNYSSDEEDDNPQLPSKVKQMLKIKPPQSQQKGISGNVCGNEIDKKPVIENKKTDVPKPKIVDMDSEAQSNSKKKLKSNCQEHDNEFINIKIEDSVSNKDANCIEPPICRPENQAITISEFENRRGKEMRIHKNEDRENKVDETKIKDSCTNPNTEELQTSRKPVEPHNKEDKTKIKDPCTNPNTEEVQTGRETVVPHNKEDETKIKDPCTNPKTEEIQTSRKSVVPHNKEDKTKIKDPCTNPNTEEVQTGRKTVVPHNKEDETKIKDPCTNPKTEEIQTSRKPVEPHNKEDKTKINDPYRNPNTEEVQTGKKTVVPHYKEDETKIKDPYTKPKTEEKQTSRHTVGPKNKEDETKIKDPCRNPNTEEVQTGRKTLVPHNKEDETKIKDPCTNPKTEEIQTSRKPVEPHNKEDETKIKDPSTNPNTEEVRTGRKTVLPHNKEDETKIKDPCTKPKTEEKQTSRNTVGPHNKEDETKIEDPCTNPNTDEVQTGRKTVVPHNKEDETKIKDPYTKPKTEEKQTSRHTVGPKNKEDETKIKDPCKNPKTEEVQTSRNTVGCHNKEDETKIKDPCTNPKTEEVQTSRKTVVPHNKEDETKIKDPCRNPNTEEVQTGRKTLVPHNKEDETKIKNPCTNPKTEEVQTSKITVVPHNKEDETKIKDPCRNPNTEEVQTSKNIVEPHNLNNNLLNDICYQKCTKSNTSLLSEADANEAKSLETSSVLKDEQNSECRMENMAKLLSRISDGNTTTFVEQKSYEKITPYEFLCTWWSSNAADDVKVGAEYLLKIQPQELPTIITNKLDTSVLCGLLKSIAGICKMGKSIEGEKYLYYLLRVPRIEVISMLLSDSEVQSIQHSFSTMEKRIHTMYVNKILQH